MKTLTTIKQKALDDFYFLAKEILGYKDLRDDPHRDLCRALSEKNNKRKKLVLMPRGSFKSSLVTVGFSIRTLIRNPNARILISSETQRNSIKYVREIRTQLEDNEKLKALFGEFSSPDRVWRDNEIVIASRTQALGDPSVMASSLERQSVVGRHFDLIICDDVVSRNNVNTQDQIQKTIDHYRLLLSVLDPGDDKMMIIVGTRWALNDLYGWIQDPENGERGQFDIFIRSAIKKDGSLLLPDRLTTEFLQEQKMTQGSYIFSCQYLNEPINIETALFQIAQIQWYDTLETENLNYFISVDPAISTYGHSDYSGVVVVAVDENNHWWIVKAMNLKVDPGGLIEEIFSLVARYQPLCLVMEKFMLEKMMKVALIEAMNKKKVFFGIREVPTNTRFSKEARIRSLSPKFEAKEVHLKRTGQEELYHELINYPQSKHDDVLDALKNISYVAFAPNPRPGNHTERLKHLPLKDQQIWEEKDQLLLRKRVKQTKWIRI